MWFALNERFDQHYGRGEYHKDSKSARPAGEEEMSGRTVVIGDIHGCYDELRALLKKVALGAADRVISVGDLIVKGEKSREVLDLFIADERFNAVLGNHDRALLRRWQGEGKALKASQEKALRELEVNQ